MRYQGGKSKIAKQIAEKITTLEFARGRNLISLFCGSCAVECKLANSFSSMVLNDNHFYLIELYKGLQNGYILPDDITEEQYRYVKEHQTEDPVLTGFVGFGCSFGGKWFGGYGRSKNRSHAAESKRALTRDMAILQNATFTCKDYRDVELPQDCVIYADPPYNNTTGYGREKFDSEKFWEYARGVSKNHLMFISEQTAPADFVTVWERPFTRTLDVNKQNQFKVTEKLFIHKSQAERLNLFGTNEDRT